ncbi:hypothetical protein BTVI_43875 [Pitangus sulphuratus]|nr:hypothetical protein BTVI_43875 [Pitangus sulphuratus]
MRERRERGRSLPRLHRELWHQPDRRRPRKIPVDVVNKTAAMSPPTSKKETQAFLGGVGFWRIHIPDYSQIVRPLYHVTQKKNDSKGGPEQQQAFEQIKQEIVHAVALGPVRTGQGVKKVLYAAAGNNGPLWSFWQKVPEETQIQPLGLWSQGYKGSEACYIPTEKEILAAYEAVPAASEVIGTKAQLLLALRLPVLGWMFKGKVPSTHPATDVIRRIHQKWKTAVWSSTWRVAEAIEGQSGSSQTAELKAIQLALDIAEREKWPATLTRGWWQTLFLGGWIDKKRPVGNTEGNPSGLLNCGKILLCRKRSCL